jgi:TolB-like protein
VTATKGSANETTHKAGETVSQVHSVGKKGKVVIAALVTLVAVMAVYYFSTNKRSATITDKSIAVLPFVDMTPDHEFEFLGDGIADEIINSLTSVRDLRVIGRTSSFQFKGEKLDLRDIGKRLNVATILEGSIQQVGQ